MRNKNLAFLLACLGLLTVALASAPVPAASAPVAAAAAVAADFAPTPDTELTLSGPDACPPLPPATEELTPVAICRLLPDCFSNDDCDVRCGTSGGRCVHSKCPVRICKCN